MGLPRSVPDRNWPPGCRKVGLTSIVVEPCPVCQAGRADSANLVAFKRDKPMRTLVQSAVNFLKREDGPTAVEYAVMLALIIVVCISAITALGSNASGTFTYVANNVAAAS